MNRKQRIENILIKVFKEFTIKIVDNSKLHSGHNNFDGMGETHLKIILKTKSNNKLNRLKIHREINDLVKDEYNNGLHSLEIKLINS